MPYDIVPIGDPIVTYEALRTIQLIFAPGGYALELRYLAATGAIIGIIIACIKGIFTQKLELQWVLASIILYTVLFKPIVTVSVLDRDNGYALIGNVNIPAGLAIPSAIYSNIGDGLTKMFTVSYASSSANTQYSSTMESLRILTKMKEAFFLGKERDADIVTGGMHSTNLRTYLDECIIAGFNNSIDKTAKIKKLLNTPDLLTTIQSVWAFKIANYNNDSFIEPLTCPEYYARIVLVHQDINFSDRMLDILMNHAMDLQDESAAKAALRAASKRVYGELAGSSVAAATIMDNMYIKAALKDATQSAANKIGNFGITTAITNARESTVQSTGMDAYLTGQLIWKYATILEILVMSLLPFMIFVLMLGQLGISMISSFFVVFLWLTLWHPITALLDGIMGIMFDSVIQNHFIHGVKGFSAGSINGNALIYEEISEWFIIGNKLMMSVPLISGALIWGGGKALSGMAQNMSMGGAINTSNTAPTDGKVKSGATSFARHADGKYHKSEDSSNDMYGATKTLGHNSATQIESSLSNAKQSAASQAVQTQQSWNSSVQEAQQDIDAHKASDGNQHNMTDMQKATHQYIESLATGEGEYQSNAAEKVAAFKVGLQGNGGAIMNSMVYRKLGDKKVNGSWGDDLTAKQKTDYTDKEEKWLKSWNETDKNNKANRGVKDFKPTSFDEHFDNQAPSHMKGKNGFSLLAKGGDIASEINNSAQSKSDDKQFDEKNKKLNDNERSQKKSAMKSRKWNAAMAVASTALTALAVDGNLSEADRKEIGARASAVADHSFSESMSSDITVGEHDSESYDHSVGLTDTNQKSEAFQTAQSYSEQVGFEQTASELEALKDSEGAESKSSVSVKKNDFDSGMEGNEKRGMEILAQSDKQYTGTNTDEGRRDAMWAHFNSLSPSKKKDRAALRQYANIIDSTGAIGTVLNNIESMDNKISGIKFKNQDLVDDNSILFAAGKASVETLGAGLTNKVNKGIDTNDAKEKVEKHIGEVSEKLTPEMMEENKLKAAKQQTMMEKTSVSEAKPTKLYDAFENKNSKRIQDLGSMLGEIDGLETGQGKAATESVVNDIAESNVLGRFLSENDNTLNKDQKKELRQALGDLADVPNQMSDQTFNDFNKANSDGVVGQLSDQSNLVAFNRSVRGYTGSVLDEANDRASNIIGAMPEIGDKYREALEEERPLVENRMNFAVDNVATDSNVSRAWKVQTAKSIGNYGLDQGAEMAGGMWETAKNMAGFGTNSITQPEANPYLMEVVNDYNKAKEEGTLDDPKWSETNQRNLVASAMAENAWNDGNIDGVLHEFFSSNTTAPTVSQISENMGDKFGLKQAWNSANNESPSEEPKGEKSHDTSRPGVSRQQKKSNDRNAKSAKLMAGAIEYDQKENTPEKVNPRTNEIKKNN